VNRSNAAEFPIGAIDVSGPGPRFQGAVSRTPRSDNRDPPDRVL